MGKRKKERIPSKKMVISVAIAEYDECGSDGLCIDNVVRFKKSLTAAKFIAADLNKTVGDMAEHLGFERVNFRDVNRSIMNLKRGENKEWQTPEGTPAWLKWKVFRH